MICNSFMRVLSAAEWPEIIRQELHGICPNNLGIGQGLWEVKQSATQL